MTHRLVALAAGLALALTACAGDQLELTAEFDDVADLPVQGAVKIADVQVGEVTDIELGDDLRARVGMRLDEGVTLPADVDARLRKTSLLGENFVELVPDDDSGGRFPDGGVISDTEVVADFEDVVDLGSEVVAAVAADRLARAVEAGATGVGGRGQTLGALLDDLEQVVTAYDARSEDLLATIDGFEGFLADVGPEAGLQGEALEELTRFAEAVSEQDDRLLDALADVRDLSRTGEDVLATHRDSLDATLRDFADVTRALAERRDDLERLPGNLAMHNRNTIDGVNTEHVQVFADIILCGFNDQPGDPVRACEEPPQGQSRPPVGEPTRETPTTADAGDAG